MIRCIALPYTPSAEKTAQGDRNIRQPERKRRLGADYLLDHTFRQSHPDLSHTMSDFPLIFYCSLRS